MSNPLQKEYICWSKFLCRDQANMTYALKQNSFFSFDVILSLYHAWISECTAHSQLCELNLMKQKDITNWIPSSKINLLQTPVSVRGSSLWQGVYIRKVSDVHYPGGWGCILGPGPGHLYQETTACYFDIMIMISSALMSWLPPSCHAVSSGNSICKAPFAWFLFEVEFSSHSFYFACPGTIVECRVDVATVTSGR